MKTTRYLSARKVEGMTPENFTPVALDKSDRLMNHGPTVLVSAQHAGTSNVMAAAWACVLDYAPRPKVTVVLDKATFTRKLIEASGAFALQLPTRAMAALTNAVGNNSANDMPDKLAHLGVKTFAAQNGQVVLVDGCVGWLACRLIPEPHIQETYDLFIGEVTAAWADERVFRNGRWHFDQASDDLRTIHHVAGGNYFVTGPTVTG
jgi:flavin reductase (DIM6/NTAB) family NADH-FMN oxidoreductase RutF